MFVFWTCTICGEQPARLTQIQPEKAHASAVTDVVVSACESLRSSELCDCDFHSIQKSEALMLTAATIFYGMLIRAFK